MHVQVCLQLVLDILFYCMHAYVVYLNDSGLLCFGFRQFFLESLCRSGYTGILNEALSSGDFPADWKPPPVGIRKSLCLLSDLSLYQF